jgi:Asp-tRNA(Asn)/Glu-tRNA(Gln) amidotransferase A subunit family amidase
MHLFHKKISLSTKLILEMSLIFLLLGCATEDDSSIQLVEASINDLQLALLNGDVSCREIVEGYMARIEAYDQSRGINAITEINLNALVRADTIDQALATNQPMPELFCAPLLIKDNFDTADMVTTGGSIALKDSIPPDDAFMIRKLREAGAIVLAKTNMAEWAFSPAQSISSSYGRTTNAYDVNYVPAGSSGGTASGVAASFGVAGMGSDTGNSIRGPSSHLALFGIRSTLGLTSRDGVIPLVFDRDIAGPMTRNVEDGARLFNVIAGYDPADPLSVPGKRETDYLQFLNEEGLKGKRLGVFRSLVNHDDADAEILDIFQNAMSDLKAAGAEIIDPFVIADFEELNQAIPFCPRFRYDIAQYFETLVNPPFIDVREALEENKIADETRGAFEFHTGSPLDVVPDEWEEACPTWPNDSKRNQLLANTLTSMDAANVDAIIYPTWSNPPASISRGEEDYRGDNNQQLVPDAGLPAATIPMGFWQDHLPVGLQFAGRPYSEGTLIELAYSYEQFTKHRRPPEGYEEL